MPGSTAPALNTLISPAATTATGAANANANATEHTTAIKRFMEFSSSMGSFHITRAAVRE
jgi:hypothetical protein